MKIITFSSDPKHYDLMLEIYAKLCSEFDIELVNCCLCDAKNLEGLDLIIAHPEKSNGRKCWDRIKSLVLSNPERQFYLFAINSPERTSFFREQDNLKFIDEHNVKELFSDISAYFKNLENASKKNTDCLY